ncbi:MAG TPA: hypothetical protein VIP57_10680 [Candidatus Dormibacteraeota bacterium]
MKLVEAVRDERSLDFWIGNWTTRWKDGGGRSHRGSNVILKLDRGIRELFEGPSKPRRYVGVSVSEWNPRSSVWEQEYWDNSGYHAFFKGGWRGDRFILDQAYSETTPNPRHRLVWSSVKVESLLWNYEASEDGGQTWASRWQIAYRRD